MFIHWSNFVLVLYNFFGLLEVSKGIGLTLFVNNENLYLKVAPKLDDRQNGNHCEVKSVSLLCSHMVTVPIQEDSSYFLKTGLSLFKRSRRPEKPTSHPSFKSAG